MRQLRLTLVVSLALLLLASTLLSAPLGAQQPPSPAARADSAARLTIDRIFRRGDFDPDPAPTIRWMKDGRSYVDLRGAREGGGTDVLRIDLATGDTVVLASAATLAEGGKRLEIEDVRLSGDETKALLFHSSRPLVPHKEGGFYHLLDLKTGRLTPLARGAGARPMQHAKLSPDARRAAFVRDSDLWVVDLATGAERRLTRDGSETILNGITDWVYDEELDLEDAWAWSPDGRRIAYLRFDQSRVPQDPLVRDTAVSPGVTLYRHPKAGQPNSRVRAAVVDVATGVARALETGPDTGVYLARLGWSGDSVVIQRLPRRQDRVDVLMLSAATGRGRTVISERDTAWVDLQDQPVWLDGGRRFLWSSDRSGWRQIYLHERDGTLVRQVTLDGADVLGVQGVDEANGLVYVQAAWPDPTQKQIVRYPLAGGRGEPMSATPGTHALDVGPGAKWAVETYSRIHAPPTISAIELPSYAARRVLVANRRVKDNLARLDTRPPELFKLPLPDGTTLDAYRIVPTSFDSTRKYPVLLYVYGGPASPTVTDSWGDNRYHVHHLLAQRGYVVVSVDPHGAAWRGREWRKSTVGRLGLRESDDVIAAIRWMGTRPWADASRIAMWGRSYGGFMTALVAGRAGPLLKVAMPVVPVSDWRFYDSIYTERYMRTPAENPEGYRVTAPLTYASGVTARMLIVWSTGDDNVHPTNTVQYADKLIEAGTPFTMVMYPGRPHPLPGRATRAHWYGSMVQFVIDHL